MATTTQLEPPRRRSRRQQRRMVGLSVVVLIGIAAWPATSYISALTYPGEASFTVRTVEWVRDHGSGGLVDVAENWWYSAPPNAAAPNVASLPSPAASLPSVPRELAPIRVAAGLRPLPGEGRWAAGRAGSDGAPAIFERPDPQHGFKMVDAHGGFYADGRTAKALRPGAASVVIHSDGSATVGEWGRDATLTADVVAVRQNLELVADQGVPVAAPRWLTS